MTLNNLGISCKCIENNSKSKQYLSFISCENMQMTAVMELKPTLCKKTFSF